MSQQDWLNKDFYKVLGVSQDASAQDIKKAYRAKAKKFHPDRNPGDKKAESAFKEIGEAYGILSDPEQRKQYDAIRAMGSGRARFTSGPSGAAGGFEDIFSGFAGGGGFQAGGFPGGQGGFSAGGHGVNLEDILGGMFGGGQAGFQGGGFGGPVKGEDVQARAKLSFHDAALGTQVSIPVAGRTVKARIPAGVKDGQKIRLRGKGHPSPNGGDAGDLIIVAEVAKHPLFEMDGANLRLTVPITLPEAVFGTTIEVPLLEGGTVKLRVPEGSRAGRVLRAKGKGIPAAKGTGDLLVTLSIAVPSHVSGAAKESLKAFAEATADENPRAGLLDAARRR